MNKKSSASDTAAVYAALSQTAMENVAAINIFTESIKPPDIVGGSNMGEDEGWDYVQKAHQALLKKPELVLTELVDPAIFTQQVTDTANLLALKKVYGNWVGDMQPTFILLGKHLMTHAKYVKDALKPLAEKVSLYKPIYDEMNKLYADRNKKKEATQADKKRIEELEKHIQGLERRVQESEFKKQ